MPERLSDTLRGLLNRRVGVMLLLGFASGLPLELTEGTLQLWLSDEGVNLGVLALSRLLPLAPGEVTAVGLDRVISIDLTVIALFTLVGLPYVLKIFWAPLLDRFSLPFLGRRRGWALLFQGALIASLTGMALAPPMSAPAALAILAVVVALCSASQDIVLDAYRTDVLRDRERGVGATLFVMGYRIGMLVAGGVAAAIGELAGWPAAYLAMAGFMGLGVVATLISPPPEVVVAPPRSLATAVVEPLREFFTRNGIKAALILLAAIVLYKFGDALAGSLFSAFLRRELDFSPIEIGVVRKTVGFGATIGGMLVGGIMMARLGLFRSLLLFGVLQAVSNFVYFALAEAGHDYTLMVTSVAVENVTAGMGTAAFVSFLMALCDHRYTATQFALLSAVAILGRKVVGPLAGPAVQSMGWGPFFLMTAAVAVPALLLIVYLRPTIMALDASSEAASEASSA